MVSVSLINKINRVNVSTNVTKIHTTNVIVAKQRTIQVSSDATAGILDSTSPVTLVNTPTLISVGAENLGQLTDVDTSNKVNGATLVYNSDNGKYVVSKLSIENITGSFHGGTF